MAKQKKEQPGAALPNLHQARLKKITKDGIKEMASGETPVFPMHTAIKAQTDFEKAQFKNRGKKFKKLS